MKLYKFSTRKLREIQEQRFKLESEIQKIFEENLDEIMDLQIIKSEFNIKNKRIDTLAFDNYTNSFVIIEYKRDKNISVIDQGFSYLSLMLENKSEFIIEYIESLRLKLRREEVDWSQTRVVFVSQGFTENQILATNFRDIAIELWEVKRFNNDTISINQIKKSSSAESIKPITQQNSKLKKVSDEIKLYSEWDHLEKASELTAELYEKFKSAILNLSDNIDVVPRKTTISFKKGKNIADVIVQKKALKFVINCRKGDLNDPKKIAIDISEIGHWGNGDYQIQVEDDKDLEYIMSLVKQVIK